MTAAPPQLADVLLEERLTAPEDLRRAQAEHGSAAIRWGAC
jgi:hypothetical protein